MATWVSALAHHEKREKREKTVMMIAHIMSASALFMILLDMLLLVVDKSNHKMMELMSVTVPLIGFHWYAALSKTSHGWNARILTYSGWMGTCFSISHDHYWLFFSLPLTFFYRLLIQHLPFVVLCADMTRRHGLSSSFVTSRNEY
jgi:hypothetical protein